MLPAHDQPRCTPAGWPHRLAGDVQLTLLVVDLFGRGDYFIVAISLMRFFLDLGQRPLLGSKAIHGFAHNGRGGQGRIGAGEA